MTREEFLYHCYRFLPLQVLSFAPSLASVRESLVYVLSLICWVRGPKDQLKWRVLPSSVVSCQFGDAFTRYVIKWVSDEGYQDRIAW